MVVTPNPSHSQPTLHVPGIEPHHPPMLNVRRPRSSRNAALPGEEIVLATVVDDSPLPPTILRLPNLGGEAAATTRSKSIASIAHWVGIALGSLIALWLIFGGRRGAMPDPDAAPSVNAPARADATPAAPVWVPPPLESAGESSAPAWKPPAASAAPIAAPAVTPAETAPEATSPLDTPAATAPYEPQAPNEPQQEAWPRPGVGAPELPGTSAQAAPASSAEGPAVRTAQLEPHVDSHGDDPIANDPGASEVHPLEITVPVPQ
jgi:hypothetical protein